MGNAEELIGQDVFSAMQTEKPYKTYIKQILGKVQVKVINPFSGKPENRLLTGDPRQSNEDCLVKLWSEKEYQYFTTYNKKHLKSGTLLEHKPKAKAPSQEEKHNTMKEEELKKLLSSKFFTLQSALNKFTSEAPVYRLLILAEEMEKSEKIISAIKARLSELQEIELSDGS